jgi:hypothetical protein
MQELASDEFDDEVAVESAASNVPFPFAFST